MLARDIVRIKTQTEKMTEFTGQLKAVTLRISSVSTLNELSSAMEQAGNAIALVSGKLDTKKLAEISKNLAKEDEKLNMKQDMMQDLMDGIGESMDDPAEQERLYQQVLKDVGLEVEDIMPEASTKVVKKEEVKVVRILVLLLGGV
jgi:charged multivesicular body protein 2A